MSITQFTTWLVIVGFGCSVSLANNTFFLPGDAYFYVRLDLESARQLTDHESPVLDYGSHWNGGYGCGHLGYEKIDLTSMSAATKEVRAWSAVQRELG